MQHDSKPRQKSERMAIKAKWVPERVPERFSKKSERVSERFSKRSERVSERFAKKSEKVSERFANKSERVTEGFPTNVREVFTKVREGVREVPKKPERCCFTHPRGFVRESGFQHQQNTHDLFCMYMVSFMHVACISYGHAYMLHMLWW